MPFDGAAGCAGRGDGDPVFDGDLVCAGLHADFHGFAHVVVPAWGNPCRDSLDA